MTAALPPQAKTSAAPRPLSPAGVVYYLLAAALLVWAGFYRFRLPGWPFADPDTWGYLRPAVLKASGGLFLHSNARNFLYPGFLYLILAASKSFKAITVVQHALGLGTGVLMLCCWNKLGRFLRRIPPVLHWFLGLGMVAIYLLSNRPIFFEHDIRPESITPFFAILNILLTLLFFERRERDRPSTSLAVISSLILVNSVVLATLKTSFVLTVLFSVVPVFIALADRRESWRRRITVLAVGLAAALAVLLTEDRLAKSDLKVREFMAESLFCIHANLIARQMDDDLARGQCGPYDCAWLREVRQSLQEEMTKGWALSQHYLSFGFDPDYLMYQNSLSTFTPRYFAGDYEKQLEFYRYYYRRTLRRHPERMLAKVISQMALFYSFSGREGMPPGRIRTSYAYGRAASSLAPEQAEGRAFAQFGEYLASSRRLVSDKGSIVPPWTIRFLNLIAARLYLVALLGVLAVTAALRFAPELRQEYQRFALTTLFLFSYNFGNCLGTAIVHSLHVLRYLVAQYSFTLLSECAGLLFLLDFGLHLLRRARTTSSLTTRPATASS